MGGFPQKRGGGVPTLEETALRKSQHNFQHYVNKTEVQAKKWFSYKKICIRKQ